MRSKRICVTGCFDDLRSGHVRFLEEASRLGAVHVLLWSDDSIRHVEGKAPKFPQAERLYLLAAIRYVQRVTLVTGRIDPDTLPEVEGFEPQMWVVDERSDRAGKKAYCDMRGVEYRVLAEEALTGFPAGRTDTREEKSSRKKVIVTGCYDWLHSGHVRFFEEVSGLGDLYVVIGHDENIRLLKGEGHPMFPQEERLYMVGAIRHVKEALIATGRGWLDAGPQIDRIKPDVYVVNADGDRPEKRTFCETHGIEYVVLEREPKEGLPRRESTVLRGF